MIDIEFGRFLMNHSSSVFEKSILKVKRAVLEAFGDESMQALYMTDDRNMTTHTYHEDVAEEIYKELAGYYGLMNKIYTGIVRDSGLD